MWPLFLLRDSDWRGPRLAFRPSRVPVSQLNPAQVDLVVNFDMPRMAVDFVHRSGRTARAGRRGACLSLVTQHDIELVHAVEAHVGRSLELYKVSGHGPWPAILSRKMFSVGVGV